MPDNCYDCGEAFRRLDDYLDRELTPEEAKAVEAHLKACQECTEHFEFEEEVLACLKRKISRIDVPCDLLDRVRQALDRS